VRTKDDIFRLAYCRLRMKGEVSGEGNLDHIKTRYRHRRQYNGVTVSLGMALTASGPNHVTPASIGAPDERGYRHLTKHQSYGLRFVGYSDEVSGNDDKGYYTSTECRDEEVYRGCVFLLPGRKGEARYVAGYHDMAADYYVMDLSNVYHGSPAEHPTQFGEGVIRQAARAGDRMAERDAERERDHDYKWLRANRWQELTDTLTGIKCQCISAEDERDELRDDIREIEMEFLDIADFARDNL